MKDFLGFVPLMFIIMICFISLDPLPLLAEEGAINKKPRLTLLLHEKDKLPQPTLTSLQNRIKIQENHISTLNAKAIQTTTLLSTTVVRLNNVEATLKSSSETGWRSALFLLIGLFSEIIGAILLISAQLSEKQDALYTLRSIPPSRDLGFEDVQSKPREVFLGLLGLMLLVLGFYLEFIGTGILLGLSWHLFIIILATGIIIPFVIVYKLLGYSTEQTRTEKLRIFIGNFNRVFISSNISSLTNTLACDVCNKLITESHVTIKFVWEANSDTHPYLNEPHEFHLGHKSCLDSYYWRYNINSPIYRPRGLNNEKPNIKVYELSIVQFIDKKISLDEFFFQRKSQIPDITAEEQKYIDLCTKLKRVSAFL